MANYIKEKFNIILPIIIVTTAVITSIVIFTIGYAPKSLSTIAKENIKTTNDSSNELNVIKEITIPLNSNLPDISLYFEEAPEDIHESSINYKYNEIDLFPSTEKPNTYDVFIIYKNKEYKSSLRIIDTSNEVILKNLTIKEKETYTIDSFIESTIKDKYTISFVNNEDSKKSSAGTYDINIKICDLENTCQNRQVRLTIEKEHTGSNQTKPESTIIVKEENIVETSINYGVTKITYDKVTYSVTNGIEKEINRESNISIYERSFYKPDLSSMKIEANSLISSHEELISTLLDEINKIRLEAEVPEFQNSISSIYNQSATIRAIEIAYSGVYSKTRPDGSNSKTLYDEIISNSDESLSSKQVEYINKEFNDAKKVIESWIKNTSFIEELKNPEYTQIGLGIAVFDSKMYWVLYLTD